MNILKIHFRSWVNHFFIALLTGLVFLSSCGDDDPSADLPLEGTTWIETNFNTTIAMTRQTIGTILQIVTIPSALRSCSRAGQ
ncbi:MAG: hypothetical protein AAF519_17095 [Bacteroidota bacterium]